MGTVCSHIPCIGGNSTPPRRKWSGSVFIEPVCTTGKLSPIFERMLKEIREGLQNGKTPLRSLDATGGAYFMPNATGSNFVGVFKPQDEEPFAENNPNGRVYSLNGEGMKKGIRVTQGAYREVAAYLLDHPIDGPRSESNDCQPGFAGVPPTMLVRCLHSSFSYNSQDKKVKLGSLQMFVKSESTCEDMGSSKFPDYQVQKITVLDLRLANADRHGGNILFCRANNNVELIPIDHGYCLPETFEDCTFDWVWWHQAKKPYSPEILKYIKSLDADKDIKLLQAKGIQLSKESCRVLRIATMLLKKGAAFGLSPSEIAKIMCRENVRADKSHLENMINKTQETLSWGSNETQFLDALSERLDRYLRKRMW